MENNWFTKPGNLEDNKPNINGASFFKQGGDLTDDGMSYFQRGRSLEEQNQSTAFLKPAGDLDAPKQTHSFSFKTKKEELNTPEEIRAWLKNIVSGEKKGFYAFGEELKPAGAGQKLVSIEELQDMVKNGDNIIKAEYFDNMNMIMVEFESFSMPSKSR